MTYLIDSSPRPRRLARALLRRAAGRDAGAVAGDVAEAWRQEATTHGSGRAWLWYWWQILTIVWHARSRFVPELRPLLALRLALRGVRRDPVTALLAAVTLALGLSFSTVLYSFLDGALRELPVPEGHEVVRVEVVQPSRGGRALAIDPETATAWAEGSDALIAVGLFRGTELIFDDGDGYPRRHSAAELSPEVLDLLRVQPLLGRPFDPADRPGEPLLLGYDLWQSDFGGDPGVVGREIRVGRGTRTVIGVMPPDFGFPLSHGAWVPLDVEAIDDPAGIEVVARLAPGLEPDAAVAGLQTIWSRRESLRDVDRQGGQVAVAGFTRGRGEGGEAVAFAALASIVLGLLVVACLNTSTLLLVRAARRQRLVGIQTALGAGRAQVAMQSFLESLLIAVAGGIGGLLLAAVAIRYAQQLLSVHFGYFWMRLALDGPVVAFAAILVVGAAVAAGTLPALRAARSDPHDVLKSTGASGGARLGRAAGLFIGVQVTAATASLVGATLMASGMLSWGGFHQALPEQPVLVVTYDLEALPSLDGDVDDAADTRDFAAAVLRAAGVPGAAAALGVFGFGEPLAPFELDGVTVAREIDRRRALWNAVTPEYFELFDIATVAGTPLGAPAPADPLEAVVSRSFVGRFLDDGEAVGRRVRVTGATGTEWATIVGVVDDMVTGRDQPSPSDARIYFPIAQVAPARGMLLMPTGQDSATTATALRAAARSVDPDVPLQVMGTLEEFFTYLSRIPRVIGAMGISGALAGLLVMAVGLYGLLSFYVRAHMFELGVRIAVGAGAGSIARVVLRRAGSMLLPGMTLGIGLMYAAAPVFGLFLFGTDPRRVGPFLLVATAMVLVGLAAAAAPLRRALRVEPADVLRAE